MASAFHDEPAQQLRSLSEWYSHQERMAASQSPARLEDGSEDDVRALLASAQRLKAERVALSGMRSAALGHERQALLRRAAGPDCRARRRSLHPGRAAGPARRRRRPIRGCLSRAEPKKDLKDF